VPELPDIELYLHALQTRVLDRRLERVRLASAFLLRSVDPPLAEVEGRRVVGLRRLGKRIVLELEGKLYLVLHLMVAGRLRWERKGAAPPGRIGLAAFDFDDGTLVLTEAGSKKRASLHVVRGQAGLAAHDPGGLEPLECGVADFSARLVSENHTLKRALTDPHLFSGIGNAFSDEILHAARLSPLQWTQNLSDAEVERLHACVRSTLLAWRKRLIAETGSGWPANVTAFKDDMAVHGRFGAPCPACGTAVQRIAYAENECNYCPRCQTGGRLLADRALSRLLKADWPSTIEELEQRRGGAAS
jgi:formamidopyrimidine-DNA glycosylase